MGESEKPQKSTGDEDCLVCKKIDSDGSETFVCNCYWLGVVESASVDGVIDNTRILFGPDIKIAIQDDKK